MVLHDVDTDRADRERPASQSGVEWSGAAVERESESEIDWTAAAAAAQQPAGKQVRMV